MSKTAVIHHATNPREYHWAYHTKTLKLQTTPATFGYVELGKVRNLAAVNEIIARFAAQVPRGRIPIAQYTCISFASSVATALMNHPTALGRKRAERTWVDLHNSAATFGVRARKELVSLKGIPALFIDGKVKVIGRPQQSR
jgi:hypothetical protein